MFKEREKGGALPSALEVNLSIITKQYVDAFDHAFHSWHTHVIFHIETLACARKQLFARIIAPRLLVVGIFS